MLMTAIILIVLVMAYLLMIMPKICNKADFSKFGGYLYAHRGFFDNEGEAPENSCRAFEMAVQSGYGIELDVQLSADNIPVVFHDWNLKRICSLDAQLENLTVEQLKNYKMFHTEQKIPTLEEALETIHGKVPVIVELKSKKLDHVLYKEVMKVLKGYHGLYCIESFNPKCLRWFRNHHPEIVRGQLSSNHVFNRGERYYKFNFIFKNMLFNFVTKPDFVAYDIRGKHSLAFKICKNIYKVRTFGWTVRNEEELLKNQEKFDYIIFDSFKPHMVE